MALDYCPPASAGRWRGRAFPVAAAQNVVSFGGLVQTEMIVALRGTAFLAIWNDIAPDAEAEFNRWHTTEHMPERLWTPGISIGRRYVDPDASHSRY